MAAGGHDGFDPDAVAVLAGFAGRFAAEGRWDYAIDTARSVQRQYEELAAADPDAFAGLADQARARVERMVAEATAIGAPTALAPSAEVREWVATMSAATDPALEAPRRMAVELDGLAAIPARKLRKADASVRAAVDLAQRLPTTTARDLAEKLARHAVILRRFARPDLAHDAALEAVRLYETVERAPRDDGQKERGELEEGRQSIVDAMAIADATRRTVPGTPGSIPAVPWGLPVVPEHKEVKAFYG